MTTSLPDVLTDAEWAAFIRRFNEKAATGLRNKALFTLMRDAGLRTCEVLRLTRADVSTDELDGVPVTALKLRGKGGVERLVWLLPEADRLLAAWQERRSALGLGRFHHIFTTLKGETVKDAYLREVCARKGQETGLLWRLHPHALRHTFATGLLRETGNLALVQDALGHARPETTRVYARVVPDDLARAMTGRPAVSLPPPPASRPQAAQGRGGQGGEAQPAILALAQALSTLPLAHRQALAAALAIA